MALGGGRQFLSERAPFPVNELPALAQLTPGLAYFVPPLAPDHMDGSAPDSRLGGLMYRPTLYRRNAVSWVSVRSWRADAKGADLAGIATRFQATERYYARNQCIVEDCDRLIAFVAPDRSGGTEDTIRRAQRAGKPVELR